MIGTTEDTHPALPETPEGVAPATPSAAQAGAGRMKRDDHFSASTLKRKYGLKGWQVEAIVAGGYDFEDIRWCPSCRSFFNADFFVAAFVYNGAVEFGCADCADIYGRVDA